QRPPSLRAWWSFEKISPLREKVSGVTVFWSGRKSSKKGHQVHPRDSHCLSFHNGYPCMLPSCNSFNPLTIFPCTRLTHRPARSLLTDPPVLLAATFISAV